MPKVLEQILEVDSAARITQELRVVCDHSS
jgi:hypothetical protein